MQYYFQFPVRGISHSRPLPSGVPAMTSFSSQKLDAQEGFEPPTSCLWGKRAAELLHRAMFWREGTDSNRRLSFVQCRVATARHVSRERSNLLSYPLVVFRLPFVKERRYYRIRHMESQGQKYTLPFVVGRALRCGGMNRDPSRSQRNQLEFAVALASEDVSVGSMVAVIFEWRRVSTTPK